MSVYVVSGVTGHVGSVVAGELLNRGASVRVIVRDAGRAESWRDRGAQLAEGALEDRAFLARTLAGAAGFFVLLPPNETAPDYFATQRRTADAIAAAVRESGVPHVVMLSSLGAELAEGTGPIRTLYYLESVLRATGTKLSAIRAAYFQENIAEVIPAAREQGIFPSFIRGAIPMVATGDIGRLAANQLESPPERSEVVDLAGPEYSGGQLAGKLGAALGRPLRVVDIPPAEHVPALMRAGLPRASAEVMAEMYAAIAAGRIVAKGDRMVAGTTPIEHVLPVLVARSGEKTRAAG